MCGRVVIALDSDSLAAIARSRNMHKAARHNQSYNIAPGRYIPAVYRNTSVISVQKSEGLEESEKSEETKDENEKICIETMKWGTKNTNDIFLVNARSETVSLYYKNWKRCVLIVTGYYEWKNITSKTNSDEILSKQPYYIYDKRKNHFLLAGVYKDIIDNVKNIFMMFKFRMV